MSMMAHNPSITVTFFSSPFLPVASKSSPCNLEKDVVNDASYTDTNMYEKHIYHATNTL